MSIVYSPLPVYAIAVSLLAAILIGISGKKPNLREFWTLSAAFAKFGIVVAILMVVLQGKVIEYNIATLYSNLNIGFKVDALGVFFALTASFLWIITSFYSIGYVRALKEHAQTRYFMCFAIAVSATIGAAFSANMFTTFIFYEILTISTFFLVSHKETPEASKGARKYIAYLLIPSVAFQLLAVLLTYNAAGTLDFSPQGILAGKAPDTLVIIIFVLFMAGIAKAAMMPFHSWLPAAMVAPTPVSALLHAVAVVKTGVFVVLKVVLYIFGTDLLQRLGLGTALAYVASFTIIVASVIALRQDNLKLRLAYSTIGQLSYIILAVAMLTSSGVTASIMHIAIHAFSKITLFFGAGAIYVAAHKTKVNELDGIGRQMPFTMAAFTIGALSMIGIPPTSGFISKWYLILGSIEAGQLVFIGVIAVSTILNAAYFLPIVYAAFFKEPDDSGNHYEHEEHNPHYPPLIKGGSGGINKGRNGGFANIKEAPILMVAPIVLTATGTLVLFIWPSLFLNLTKLVISNVF